MMARAKRMKSVRLRGLLLQVFGERVIVEPGHVFRQGFIDELVDFPAQVLPQQSQKLRRGHETNAIELLLDAAFLDMRGESLRKELHLVLHCTFAGWRGMPLAALALSEI